MEKIIINVEKSTRMVSLTKTTIGNDLENLQEELVFKFTDEFVSGSARLEYKVNGNKYHIPMTRDGESYTVPIKNVITKEGKIEMQLVIVETEQDEEIPVFKSNVFYVYCNKSINAQEEAPDDYEYWLDVMQTKLASIDEALEEVDNLNIISERVIDGVEVRITDKEGNITTTKVNDGADAKINGVNTLNIEAGDNITLEQDGNTLTINSTGGGSGGTSDYSDLTNKPKINNIELNGNKSLNDLGIQPAGNYLTSEKVKNTNSTTAGDVYDVRYINTMIGDIESLLSEV